jgi:hypothetical protein
MTKSELVKSLPEPLAIGYPMSELVLFFKEQDKREAVRMGQLETKAANMRWFAYSPKRCTSVVILYETAEHELISITGNARCQEGQPYLRTEGIRIAAKRALRKLQRERERWEDRKRHVREVVRSLSSRNKADRVDSIQHPLNGVKLLDAIRTGGKFL